MTAREAAVAAVRRRLGVLVVDDEGTEENEGDIIFLRRLHHPRADGFRLSANAAASFASRLPEDKVRQLDLPKIGRKQHVQEPHGLHHFH